MPVARKGDPQTSWDAARSVTNVTPLQRLILDTLRDAFLERQLPGLTDEGLGFYITECDGKPVSSSGLRSRRSELVDAGLVRASGRYHRTKANRRTTIWTLTPEGWKA